MSFRGGHRRNTNRNFNNNAQVNFEENDLRSRIGDGSGNNNTNGNGNGMVTIEIRNWNNATKDEAVSFIQRKAQIKLHNPHVNNQILLASVKESESNLVQKYSGIRFAGAPLDIQISKEGTSAQTQNAVKLLETYLQNHYIPQQKMLNLDNMKNDPFLLANGLLASPSVSSKMFPAMMKVSSMHIKDVETVSLANNELTDVKAVTTLAATYPNLKNLSLANNNIARLSGLESWKHKFPYLQELILVGNSVVRDPRYKTEVLKLFPRLVMLDGEVVQDASQLDKLHLPVSVKQNFFETPDLPAQIGPFLTSYYEFFDKNRPGLIPLYDSLSTFSLNINTTAPRTMQYSSPPGWGAWISISRNLEKITTIAARVNRLFIGPQAINEAFQKLPTTKHDLKNPEKFSLEAWTVGSIREPGDRGVMVVVHGEFEEGPNSIKRSFDRSMVILPSGPDGNMIIASDMFTIRAYAGIDSWKETNQVPPTTAQPTPDAQSSAALQALQSLGSEQQQLVKNLMQETRLNAEFALMCLQQAQFNYPQALELFKQSHASNSIPPNAFM